MGEIIDHARRFIVDSAEEVVGCVSNAPTVIAARTSTIGARHGCAAG
jgi:hypothetical protein